MKQPSYQQVFPSACQITHRMPATPLSVLYSHRQGGLYRPLNVSRQRCRPRFTRVLKPGWRT